MKQAEKDAIQKKIDELQAALDEEDKPIRNELSTLGVYETPNGALLMSINQHNRKYRARNTTLDAGNEVGLENGAVGPNDESDFIMEGFEFLGEFNDVFVRKDVLKKNFLKMRDWMGDTVDSCMEEDVSFNISHDELEDFIDNLIEGK